MRGPAGRSARPCKRATAAPHPTRVQHACVAAVYALHFGGVTGSFLPEKSRYDLAQGFTTHGGEFLGHLEGTCGVVGNPPSTEPHD